MSIVSITDFGAKCDTCCTVEIQTAIDYLAHTGGGRLVFPSGRYICGGLELKSNITLYLEPGSVLKASGSISDFKYIGFHHNELGETKSLLYALGKENIVICGDGVIDLSDEAYVDFDDILPFGTDISMLNRSQRGECVVNRKGTMNDTLNQSLFFDSCKNVKLRDIKLIHSPVWTLTFSRCSDVIVRGVTVENRRITGNSDGIHICASKNIIVNGCNIKAGDDCVAVTCITDENGISENIVISDCNFESSSAGIRLGHSWAKVRNVIVSNINITDSNRGIAIFSGDGGYVENCFITGLNIETRVICGAWWGKGEPVVICAAESDG